jgi:DNA-binding MarR family transcriptional regulator
MCQRIEARYVNSRSSRNDVWASQKNYESVILSSVTAQLHAEDYQALAAFRYALRKFLSFSKAALAKADLTPEQYEALLALKAFTGDGGCTISDLSERLQVKHHSAVGLVDKLEQLQLVRREQGRDDRRKVFVRLTPKGSELLGRVAVIHRQEMRIRSPEMMEALLRLQK